MTHAEALTLKQGDGVIWTHGCLKGSGVVMLADAVRINILWEDGETSAIHPRDCVSVERVTTCGSLSCKVIHVYLDGDGWMTQNVGHAETIRIFGTDILPTPFLKETPADKVLAVIRELNPDATVIHAGGPVVKEWRS